MVIKRRAIKIKGIFLPILICSVKRAIKIPIVIVEKIIIVVLKN